MNRVEAPRQMYIEQMLLEAPPTEVFPLLCPVREYEWIPGWECAPVHLSSGYAEEDGVFTTAFERDGPLDTWVITRYRPPVEIEFLRVNAWRVVRFHIGLKPEGEEQTRATWRQLITATSDEGRAWLEGFTEDSYKKGIATLGGMLNRFLASAAST